MSFSNFPAGFDSGVTIRNLPVLDISGGNVFWVDSNAALSGNKGTFKHPFTTIDAAIGLAAASHGDLIIVKAGHAENLSTAAIFALDKAGIRVAGLGEGRLKPTFSTTATGGALMITAADCVVENLRFVANANNTVQAIDIDSDSDGTVIRNCDFYDTTTSEFLKHIDVATTIADVTIEGCKFISTAGNAMTSSIYFTGSSSNCIIRNNLFFVAASGSIVDMLNGIATAVMVYGNRMINVDTGAGLGLGIKSDTTSTGVVFDNYILTPKTGTAVLAVTNDFFVCQNYCANDINASGVLNPAADAI